MLASRPHISFLPPAVLVMSVLSIACAQKAVAPEDSLTPLVFLILEMRPVSEYLAGRRKDLPLPPLRRDTSDHEDEGTGRRED